MWNFGIPYVLKHYIDVLVQPGLTFASRRAKGTKAWSRKARRVVYARGGAYGPDRRGGYDKQSDYIQQVLGFIGITNVKSIRGTDAGWARREGQSGRSCQPAGRADRQRFLIPPGLLLRPESVANRSCVGDNAAGYSVKARSQPRSHERSYGAWSRPDAP